MMTIQPLDTDVDLVRVHQLAPTRYPVLFESSAFGTALGRFDMLLYASGQSLTLQRNGICVDQAGNPVPGTFLDALDACWSRQRLERSEAAVPPWPFRGGWALLLGYELGQQIEPVLRLPHATGGLPVAAALRCPAAIVRDRSTGACTVLAEPGQDAVLAVIAADVAAAGAQVDADRPWVTPHQVHEDSPARFIQGVERVLDYLAAGDVFQVNLSRGWQVEFERPVAAAALLQRLRSANPAPFSGLFTGPGWAVASASPERLLAVRGRRVDTRPIAGTRPRVAGDDDTHRIGELIGHPKERAEHVMLIDLARNDLGRIARPGSIQVDELMGVESYSHVHHIVSNVCGTLNDGVTPGQAIAAVFPGGTITGCPKVRCMQIIAALEECGRGIYTGAMGWLNRDGDMDLNILIRSAEMEGTTLRFRTGAGIVIDSVPQRELEETRAKARGMLQALGVHA